MNDPIQQIAENYEKPEPVRVSTVTMNHMKRILESPYGERFLEFAVDCIEKLDANAHKGRWEGVIKDDMFMKMVDEVCELRQAMRNNEPIQDQKFEAADVSNFAFIVWDVIDRG